MSKTSKITNVRPNGTFDSKYGTMHKFEYTFDDGQVLTASHKEASNALNKSNIF